MIVSAFGWSEADALGSMIGGLSTAAALGATLAILVREIRTRKLMDLERDRERRDNERRQARMVYATLDPERPIPSDHLPRSMRGSENEVYVRVFNQSEEPIWDAKVYLPERKRPLLFEQVGPHDSDTNGWLDAPDEWYLMNVGPGCPGTPHWLPLDIVFVDNRGLRWRRSGRSEPVRLLDNEDLVRDDAA
ncbi:hypothetical protein [Actinoplanes sp. NPDC049599]|uniref:hypothetical protein n=1 Tax=Actinoplanes sp. NPDC049599 TaxID=3363903 RepID=UPI00379D5702